MTPRIHHTDTLTLVDATVHGYVQKAIELAKTHTTYGQIESTDTNFYGDAPDWPTMVQRAYDGYNARAIAGARDLIIDAMREDKESPSLHYTGDEFSPVAYIQGSKRCFYRYEGEPRRPLVHLIYRGNTNAGTSSDAYINHGGAIAALAAALDATADLKITATYTTSGVFNGGAIMCVRVKDSSESLDIPRLGVTTHPSFHRRVSFTWYGALFPSLGKQHISESGSARNRDTMLPDEEFFAWIGGSGEDLVVDLPAADMDCFGDADETADWVKLQAAKIQDCINSGQAHHRAL